MKRISEFFFFGNWFYAVSAVFITLASSWFQGFFIPYFSYYLLIFSATVLYYSIAYTGIFGLSKVSSKIEISHFNEREKWYYENNRKVFLLQILLSIIIVICGLFFLYDLRNYLANLRIKHLLLASVFLVASIFYYGNIFFLSKKITLRTGLIKPFVIGFVWAGVVTVFPALIHSIANDDAVFSQKMFFSFYDYFLFISILCILFDIKDYTDDFNEELKTFVVRFGVKNTIGKILIPLIIFYFLSVSIWGICINIDKTYFLSLTIVTIFLLLITINMHQTKSLFFYLLAIDGLMFLKAMLEIIFRLF